MSQTLYEEAIAEARRLTEMAEQNAKNKIIDAVTPQIKRLIEQELMDDSDEEDLEELVDDLEGEEMVLDLDSMLMTPPVDDQAEESDEVSLQVSDGEVELEVGGVKIEVEPTDQEDDDEEVLLDEPMHESLAEMLAETPQGSERLRSRLHKLGKKVLALRTALDEAKKSGTDNQKERITNIFETLARETVTLRRQVILTEKDTGARTLETELVGSIIKEMKNMSRSNNKNVFDFLFEADEDDEADTEAEDSETADEVTVDVDTAKDLLVQLGDAMDLEVDVEAAEEVAEEEAEEEAEFGEEDLLDLGETDDMDETVYELDEASLRRELSRLRKINESDAVDAADSFGGGEAEEEAFVEVDEETLLNALADELGPVAASSLAETRRARRRRPAPRRQPARRRRPLQKETNLRRQVKDYKNVANQLKQQLVEMNLFNAKLLYANKLMQNRELSAKQQRAIVEALDNAKTLREAKLLYKSLTSSLKKGANKGNLAEGRTRVLGSSSKSARSAQPTDTAGGNDRWALLAGLDKD